MPRTACRVTAAAIALALGSHAAPCGACASGVARHSNHGAQVVAAARYVGAARAALMQELRSLPGRFELQARGGYRDVPLAAAGRVEFRTRIANVDALPSLVVWLDIVVANRIARRLPVHFRVRRFLPALVAKRRLPARTALRADMFERREVDVAGVRGGAVSTAAQLRGKRLRRALGAGSVLALDAIEARPPVELGERIRIEARVGHVTVQRTAIAQRDGFAGQRIRVRLPGGRETVRVEVVGENAAEVQGDG